MEFKELWVYIAPVVKMLLIFLVGHFLIVYLVKIISKSLSKSKLDPSLIRFVKRSVKIICYTLVILSALSAIGISTTGIIAAMSAAAVAVAVALKDSLSNVAGGILLLISPRFVTDDFIETEGYSGKVIDVDLLHTTILSPDNKQISIPNGVLINSPIINYSREPLRRLDINFAVAYDCDVDKAKSIIMNVISKSDLILNEPDEPFVSVSSYGDSAINIVARVWCKNENYWTLNFDLLKNVKAEFDKNGISIPYNQLDVHIK